MTESDYIEYIKTLREENARLKRQSLSKPIIHQWLELERLKYSTMIIVAGIIIGNLALNPPAVWFFPKPVQEAVKNAQCTTNAVYKRLGI